MFIWHSFIQLLWNARHCGEGNGNPLQYSCLENPMDIGSWWATVHVVTKSQTWLSDYRILTYTISNHYVAHSKLIQFYISMIPQFLKNYVINWKKKKKEMPDTVLFQNWEKHSPFLEHKQHITFVIFMVLSVQMPFYLYDTHFLRNLQYVNLINHIYSKFIYSYKHIW